ncbi:MAG: hypothetical protein LAO09_11470 [Acidobacteriia bacterium]|nr:hypothetical protein [Terriglobia bacterium]
MGKVDRKRGVNRAPRVKLAGTVLVLMRLENGRQLRAKLHQLSTSGGLLHLEQPLDEGIKVEVIFHVGNSTVRTKARVLFPMWATQGYLQPFEFEDLGELDRRELQIDLQKLLESSAAAVIPSPDRMDTQFSDSPSPTPAPSPQPTDSESESQTTQSVLD